MKADNATYWHDTYQQSANATDEFLGDLLALLPGAENEGMDAYDQIPRAIKALRDERDQLEAELTELAHVDLNEALNAPGGQAEVRIAGLTVYRGPEVDARRYAAGVVRQSRSSLPRRSLAASATRCGSKAM